MLVIETSIFVTGGGTSRLWRPEIRPLQRRLTRRDHGLRAPCRGPREDRVRAGGSAQVPCAGM
jgi:hypothetical protein